MTISLNKHLIARVQRSVKADAGLDVSSDEVLAVYNGDWDEANMSESKAIEQALQEYGFVS